ncbi:MAG: hypothetical protein L0027_15515 [Candidatus Rokubacteria bacterium]|nr:hypothetical protein [Candidatus Rokubacteria bacterium]
MNRVLLIEQDRDLVNAMSLRCVEHGIALRIAETVCEGVRYLLHAPAAVVMIDAELLRLSGLRQAALFETVAPGVPVVVLAGPSVSVEERVRYEVQGFPVFAKPIDVIEVLGKIEVATTLRPARPGAAAAIEAACA